MTLILLIIIGVMSLAAFAAFGLDKYKAKAGKWRIPERTLFLLALLGGCILYQWGLPRVDIVLQATPLMALSALIVFIVLTQLLYADFHLVLPLPGAMSAS